MTDSALQGGDVPGCWFAFCLRGPWTPSGAEALRRRSLSFSLALLSFFFLLSLALLFCQRAAQHCPPAFGRPHGWHARAVTMADPSHFCLCWPLLFLLLSHSLPSPRVSSVFQQSTRGWPTGHRPVILCRWPIWFFLQSCSPAWVCGSRDFAWSSKAVACLVAVHTSQVGAVLGTMVLEMMLYCISNC